MMTAARTTQETDTTQTYILSSHNGGSETTTLTTPKYNTTIHDKTTSLPTTQRTSQSDNPLTLRSSLASRDSQGLDINSTAVNNTTVKTTRTTSDDDNWIHTSELISRFPINPVDPSQNYYDLFLTIMPYAILVSVFLIAVLCAVVIYQHKMRKL